MSEEKERLRFCLSFDQRNLVFFRADLRHFYWFAETDRAKGGPTPAFYYDQMANDPALLRNVYSFLGPALIPLALRYKADGNTTALHALNGLYKQMPPEVIPPNVKMALPEVFAPTVMAAPQLVARTPDACSEGQIDQFVKLVEAGGEVTSEGLVDRVRGAASLIFLTQLQGIAALKHPQPGYRQTVSTKSGVPLSEAAFPFELGWVFVVPAARGNRYANDLVRAAVATAGGRGIFATSREDNMPMHRALEKFGFARAGQCYPSERGDYKFVTGGVKYSHLGRG